MKTSDWLKEQKPVFTWEVPSKSNPGTFHRVSWFKDDHWYCDCLGYKYKRGCKHIRIVKMKYAKRSL